MVSSYGFSVDMTFEGKTPLLSQTLGFPIGKLIYWFLNCSSRKANQLISFQEQKSNFCSAEANLLSKNWNHFLSPCKNRSACSSCPSLIWKYFYQRSDSGLVCFLHETGLQVSSLCLTSHQVLPHHLFRQMCLQKCLQSNY